MNLSKKTSSKIHSRFRVGDSVIVITGSHKGTFGTISQFLNQGKHVVLREIDPILKYKVVPNKEVKEVIELPVAIHHSNVMAWDKRSGKRSRLGVTWEENQKVRYLKTSGEMFSSGTKRTETVV